jgi:lysyl-tRNA synthetase class I
MNEIDREEIKDMMKESLEEIFFSEDEYAPFNSLNDKINKLLTVHKAEERLATAIKYCDKFEDYMKNIDKLNMMINEFKGLVAIVRGKTKIVEKASERMQLLEDKMDLIIKLLGKPDG